VPDPTSARRAPEAPAEARSGTGRQLQQLIVTIVALHGRGDDGAIAVAELIRMLGALDVDDAAARSALSRLKKRGILVSDKKNGGAAYRLHPDLEDVFAEGDERIFSPRRARPGDRWLLAAFSVPESQRNLRHQIRRVLAGRGFGTVGAGLWIAPEFVYDHLRHELEREGLAEFVEFFAGDVLGSSVATRVADWWDLDALTQLYAGFLAAFAPVRERWGAPDAGTGAADDARAFADYVHLLTAWRRLPYLDPGLPLEYLPADWQGLAAERLFLDLHERLAAPAARYAAGLLTDPD
jgi:phenylacetic acid degradation operon negative regulatory protein